MLRSWFTYTYFCQILELILTLAIVLIAWRKPDLRVGFERIETYLATIAEKPKQAALTCFAAFIIARLLLLPAIPVPAPSIHDEFSYLLAAKTFAAGRLTNVPNVEWPSLESVHILQQPSYMSMYPPGQGLVLAAGVWAAGCAWAGVLVCAALLCSAIYWALGGWMPRSWALAAAGLAGLRWLLVSYWGNSYWGGTLSALGGALVFGSVPRLAKMPRKRDALLMACGLVVLGNTRPYEGLVLAICCLVMLAVWSKRSGAARELRRAPIVLTIVAVLAPSAAGLLYYNARVTGDALRLPYVEDRKQYAMAPLLVWGHPSEGKSYRSGSLANVYKAEVRRYELARKALGIPEVLRKLKDIWIFFAGPLLTIPLLAALWKGSKRESGWHRAAGWPVAVALVAALQVVWFYPHYLAPAFAPVVAWYATGLRQIRNWKWHGRDTGLWLSRALPAGCVLMAAVPVVASAAHVRLSYWPLQWALGAPAEVQPASVREKILADGNRALVFVEYDADHDAGYEWVYNEPDVERARIVWARHTNEEQDRRLIEHFRDRTLWRIRPDRHPVDLQKMTGGAAESKETRVLTSRP